MLDSPVCHCGHALAVHDPCSICLCSGFDPSRRTRKYPVRGTPNAMTEIEARARARAVVDAERKGAER